MVKMFADQQMDVGADVLAYLVNRMDGHSRRRGSGNQAEQRVAGCQAGITVPLARDVLETLESFGEEN